MELTENEKHPLSLRSLRMDAHLTVTELARRMGRNQSYVTSTERGYCTPRATRLVSYLRAVNRDDLADAVAEAAKIVAYTTGRAVDPSGESLYRYFHITGNTELATLTWLTTVSRRSARTDRSEH